MCEQSWTSANASNPFCRPSIWLGSTEAASKAGTHRRLAARDELIRRRECLGVVAVDLRAVAQQVAVGRSLPLPPWGHDIEAPWQPHGVHSALGAVDGAILAPSPCRLVQVAEALGPDDIGVQVA